MSTIDIAQLPVAEKLKLMEALWDSLSVNADGGYESPAWHEQTLKQSEGNLTAGTAHFVDWTAAKEQLRGHGQT
jgi:hypothetical protein